MSKQALKRVRKTLGLPVCREPLPAFAWPGGYPLFYLFAADSMICCPACANAHITDIDADRAHTHGQWTLAGHDVNWEDTSLICDHCGKAIESAYGN